MNLKEIKTVSWKKLSLTGPRWQLGLIAIAVFFGAAAIFTSVMSALFD